MRHPFTVRAQSSGYTRSETFIVVRNPGGRRVTVNPHYAREHAQADADALNIAAMVKDEADDPRPYRVRYAEAEAAYRGTMTPGRSPGEETHR
jgi:hypothetical protein